MLRPSFVPAQAIPVFTATCFWLAVVQTPVVQSPAQAGEGWRVVGEDHVEGRVCLKSPADREIRTDLPFVVITHGMKGTCEGDRFHLLGEAIASAVPDANVVLVDWSEASRASWIPIFVAWSIDSIADEASDDLCNLGFQASQATMIGESFGNFVNARIADSFGQVDQIIAMNPASELGGYPVPDLRRCSKRSWSFHTYSIFDSLRRMAHRCIIIQTAADANDADRHTEGIRRLIALLRHAHTLTPPVEIGLSEEEDGFDAQWGLDGSFKPTLQKRKHPALEMPVAAEVSANPEKQAAQTDGNCLPDPASPVLIEHALASR